MGRGSFTTAFSSSYVQRLHEAIEQVWILVLLQALMAEAVKTPNVVKACNKKGLYEELEHIQSRLSICEKALAEYLETKRLAFPRFYFISSADLLDILSKGNQPVEVKCMCKCILNIVGYHSIQRVRHLVI